MIKKILLILIILILIIYFYSKIVIKSLKFDFKLESLKDILIKNITFNSINNGTAFLEIKIAFILSFNFLFNIKIKNLYIEAYFNNNLVGKTTNNEENKKDIILIKNIENKFYQTFDLYTTKNTLDLALLIESKQKYNIDYKIQFKILNLTIKYNGTYEGS